MFCHKCGIELPDDSQFCRKCGQSITISAASSTGAAAAPAPIQQVRRSAYGRVLLFVVVLLAIWFASKLWQQANPDTERLVSHQAFVPSPTVIHRTVQLVNGSIVVQPSHYLWYRVDIPDRSSSVRIAGHFTATGGSGNDVEIALFDNDGFANWQNHHSSQTYYSSGRVTQGTIAVNLPNAAKTYYLVVNNVFSLVSNKAVSGEIKAEYDQTVTAK